MTESQQAKTAVSVYVIMPFATSTEERTSDYWDEHFEHFIVGTLKTECHSNEVLNQYDWSFKRSSVIQGGPINYEIIWDLLVSNIVIADLTDMNFNVLYELGVRHTFSAVWGESRTIMIQDESVFKLPFDFANYSVLKYDKKRINSWKQNMVLRLQNCLTSFNYKDNPVSMALAQQNFSFRTLFSQDAQPTQLQTFQSAIESVKALKELGFPIEWIQKLIEQSIDKSNEASRNDIVTSTMAAEVTRQLLSRIQIPEALVEEER